MPIHTELVFYICVIPATDKVVKSGKRMAVLWLPSCTIRLHSLHRLPSCPIRLYFIHTLPSCPIYLHSIHTLPSCPSLYISFTAFHCTIRLHFIHSLPSCPICLNSIHSLPSCLTCPYYTWNVPRHEPGTHDCLDAIRFRHLKGYSNHGSCETGVEKRI